MVPEKKKIFRTAILTQRLICQIRLTI